MAGLGKDELTPIGELVSQVHQLLGGRNQTLAVAESLTGGLVLECLTSQAGSSLVVAGGVVAYNSEAKVKTLGIPLNLMKTHTVVSAEVAGAMAANVRDLFAASWGLGTTGVAGPGSVGGSPPGRVFVAVAGENISKVAELDLTGDRAKIRAASCEQMLRLLIKTLA